MKIDISDSISKTDDLILDHVETTHRNREIIATQNFTKIWDDILRNLGKISRTPDPPSENFNLISSTNNLVSFESLPQEEKLFDFNSSHFVIMKSVYLTIHDNLNKSIISNSYKIFSMFPMDLMNKVGFLVDNSMMVSLDTKNFELTILNCNDKSIKKTHKDEYFEKYQFIQEILEVGKIQLRINCLMSQKIQSYLKEIPTNQDNQNSNQIEIITFLNQILGFVEFEKFYLTKLLNFMRKFEILRIKKKPSNGCDLVNTIEKPNLPNSINDQYVKSKTPNLSKRKCDTKTQTINTKVKQPKYVEVVRNKEERKSLIGHTCHLCKDFYEKAFGKDSDKYKEAIQICSRHRSRFSPDPGTPPGFWDLDIHTPEEWKIQDEKLARKTNIESETFDEFELPGNNDSQATGAIGMIEETQNTLDTRNTEATLLE